MAAPGSGPGDTGSEKQQRKQRPRQDGSDPAHVNMHGLSPNAGRVQALRRGNRSHGLPGRFFS
jgi:hypothetical protein